MNVELDMDQHHYIIVDKSTNQIVTEYFADQKGSNSEFADENKWLELEIPLQASISYLRVVCNQGKYSLAEDTQKKQAYNQALLQSKVNSVRNQRDQLLVKSDWTQVIDSPLTDVQKLAWKKYRQKLRDITKGVTLTQDVIWPDPPV